jgi:hypothetical protein
MIETQERNDRGGHSVKNMLRMRWNAIYLRHALF